MRNLLLGERRAWVWDAEAMGHGRREIRAKLCDRAVGGLTPSLDEAVPVCTALFLADLAGGIIRSRLRGFGLQGAREQVLGHGVSGGRGGCGPHPIRQHWLNRIRLASALVCTPSPDPGDTLQAAQNWARQ